MREAVGRFLGYDPFRDSAEQTVSAHLGPGRRGLEAVIELHDAAGLERGARRIAPGQKDCAQLAEAVALAMAIAIDPLVLERAARPKVQRTPTVPRAGVAMPPGNSRATPTQPEAAPVRAPIAGRIGISGHGAFGVAPAATAGFDLLAGLRRGRFSAGLGARLDLPAYRDVDGGRISAWAALGQGLACVHAGSVAACAMGAGGVLRVDGHEFHDARGKTRPWAGAGGRLAVEFPLAGRLALQAYGDLLFAFTRTALLVDDHPLWETPAVSAAVGAGVLTFFP